MCARIHALSVQSHELINQYIVKSSLNGFSLDSYLRSTLQFPNGIDEVFTSQVFIFSNSLSVSDWIKFGGKYEDEPPWYNPSIPYLGRSKNHFHNPLNKQGYTGPSWVNWLLFGQVNGQSSIQWSQSSPNTQSPGGYYSWHDVRNYFFNALTAINDTERQQNFADTFRGLGQLMHLVEDLSVPEHTRNAFHAFGGYEGWVSNKVTDNINSNYYIGNYAPIFFDPTVIGNSPSSALTAIGPVPITNLFDMNQYRQDNLDPNVTIDVVNNMSRIGLSEYTNANFISPTTAFAPGFNYPNWNSIVQATYSGSTKRYLKKLGKGDPPAAGGQVGNGEHIDHFAVSRWGRNLLPSSISQNGIYLKMDNAVYAEYASHLIPRAVGYAEGLLNYFFRGAVYGCDELLQFDNTYTYFTSVTLKVYNDGTETMSAGRMIIRWYLNTPGPINYVLTNPVYITENIAPGTISVNTYTFTFPQPPPWTSVTIDYGLIFRGKLGNEDDAVTFSWTAVPQ